MRYMNIKTYDLTNAISCDGRDYCVLDDAIAPVISVLNKRGYTTAFSCSGHAASGHNPEFAYIQFEFGGITPEYIPDGWYWVQDGHMEYRYASVCKEELSEEISQVMSKLLQWSFDLVDANSEDYNNMHKAKKNKLKLENRLGDWYASKGYEGYDWGEPVGREYGWGDEEPNAETIAAIKEVEEMKKDPSKGKTYRTFDDFLKEMEI